MSCLLLAESNGGYARSWDLVHQPTLGDGAEGSWVLKGVGLANTGVSLSGLCTA